MKPKEAALKNVRLTYCRVFKAVAPKAAPGQDQQEPRFSTGVLIAKSDKDNLNKIISIIKAVKEDPKELAKWNGAVPAANFKLFLKDGDVEKNDDGSSRNPGFYYFTASCPADKKPRIISRERDPLTHDYREITNESEVYSGCYANVHIQAYGFNNKAKGISARLCNIQKYADGEPLGGTAARAEDAFAELEPPETAADLLSGL